MGIEGHDWCIGTIPGAINACCGHGNLSEAYIQFEDNSEITGLDVFYYLFKLEG